jgi:hypothetical protein
MIPTIKKTNLRLLFTSNNKTEIAITLVPPHPPLSPDCGGEGKGEGDVLGDQGIDLGLFGPLAIRIIPLKDFQS